MYQAQSDTLPDSRNPQHRIQQVGYNIRKAVESSVSYFWRESRTSYPTLSAGGGRGEGPAEVGRQGQTRAAGVSLTAKGRACLEEWLGAPYRESNTAVFFFFLQRFDRFSCVWRDAVSVSLLRRVSNGWRSGCGDKRISVTHSVPTVFRQLALVAEISFATVRMVRLGGKRCCPATWKYSAKAICGPLPVASRVKFHRNRTHQRIDDQRANRAAGSARADPARQLVMLLCLLLR